MTIKFSETAIEESSSGMLRIYGINQGSDWQVIGSTLSKSEAIDIALNQGAKLVAFTL